MKRRYGGLGSVMSYRSTVALDRLRATEDPYLDDSGGDVYLDYAGAGLPAEAQLSTHVERARLAVLGISTPHPRNMSPFLPPTPRPVPGRWAKRTHSGRGPNWS